MNLVSKVFLNPKEENEIRQGFPLVFDNEIDYIKYESLAPGGQHKSENQKLPDSTVPDGTVVEVLSKAGQYLGTGILNKKSKITVRIMSRTRGA